MDNAITVFISLSAYGFVVLIWISFLYILVSTGKDVPPNTVRIFFRLNFQLFEVTPESYIGLLWIPYFHIIRDVTAVYISFVSLVDRYFMPTGSRLLRTRADEHRSVQLSWVELSWVLRQYLSSWVELRWVELGWVASCRVGSHAFGFRHSLVRFSSNPTSLINQSHNKLFFRSQKRLSWRSLSTYSTTLWIRYRTFAGGTACSKRSGLLPGYTRAIAVIRSTTDAHTFCEPRLTESPQSMNYS